MDIIMDSTKKELSSEFISFVKDNVLNITELTRTPKLTEILNQFAEKNSTEVYIVENSKKKDARAALVDLDYLHSLLKIKETVEESIDEIMYQVALERKDDVCDITLAGVIAENNLDVNEILELVNQVEEEE